MEAKVNPWCKLIQKHTIKNTIYFKIMEKELLEHLSDISKKEMVNHPVHYGGEDNMYEAFRFLFG